MKKFINKNWQAIVLIKLMLLCFTLSQCTAQTIGMNGAGFFENRTELSDAWLHEAVGDNAFALRIPGGAIAKFADPFNGNGWGLTYEMIDSIQPKYGSSEEEDQLHALEKWKRKTDQQPSYSYLEDVIEFQKEFPNAKIIYVANPFIPFERAFYPINYLLANHVNIVMVEIGNESYSQFNYNSALYVTRVSDLVDTLHSCGIPVSHPAAATGTRMATSHRVWNDALNKAFKGDYFTMHPYYDKREFPSLAQPVDTINATLQINAWSFEEQFAEAQSYFPDAAGFIVTETNIQPSSLCGDTELNNFFFQKQFPAGKKYFEYFCMHNGVGPDKYALIEGKKGEQKKNKTYQAFSEQFLKDVIIIPEDTVITHCKDTTVNVIGSYIDTIVHRDSSLISDCGSCDKFLYRIFHAKECRKCKPVYRYFDSYEFATFYFGYDSTYQLCDTLISSADTIIEYFDPVPAELTACAQGNTHALYDTDVNGMKKEKSNKFFRLFDPASDDYDSEIGSTGTDQITMRLSTCIQDTVGKFDVIPGKEVVPFNNYGIACTKGFPICEISDIDSKCIDILQVLQSYGYGPMIVWIEFYQNGKKLNTDKFKYSTPEGLK